MNGLALLWILVIVAAASWLLANILVTVVLSFHREFLFIDTRKHLWALATLPWFLPLLTVTTLLALALAKSQGWIHDHCETHPGHHPHFCFEHLPQMVLQASDSLLALFIVLSAVVLFVSRCLPILKLHAKSQSFLQLVSGKAAIKTLEDKRTLAFTLGVLKPSIFITDGLRKLLRKKELRIVVAHEVAHVRNKDVGKNILFELLLSIHILPNLLRSPWHLTSEVRADRCVAKKFDALEVADVLIKLRRSAITAPVFTSITGSELSDRIRILINAEHNPSLPISIRFLYLLLIVFPFALLVSHHGLETFWGWLL